MPLKTLLRWLLSRLRDVLPTFHRLLLRFWLALKSRAVRAYLEMWRSMRCTNCPGPGEITEAAGGTYPPDASGPVLASRQPTSGPGTGLPEFERLQERHALDTRITVGWRSAAELHPADNTRHPYLSHETDTRHASTPNFGEQTHEHNIRTPLQGVPIEIPDSLNLLPANSRHTSNPTSTHGTGRADMNQLRAVPAEADIDILRKKGIIPVDTTNILRYQRGHTISRQPEGDIIIQAMTLAFEDSDDVPSNWTRYVHPEGAVYYFDEHRRILTEADLCRTSIRETLEEAIVALNEAKAAFHEDLMPPDAELVLEIAPPDRKEHRVYYYFVDHHRRILFWLNPMYADSLLHAVPAAKRLSHIRLRLEESYWNHWEYFPINRTISEELLQEFVGTMMHLGIDSMTSRTGISPYKNKDLIALMDLAKNVNYIKSVGGYSATCIGRMMGIILHARFLNFWGQPLIARLDRSQPVYADSQRMNSLLLPLLSPVLFFASMLHYRSLSHIWLDEIVHEEMWRRFIACLQEDWDKYLLRATVLLSANVAFLAIPSMDQTNQAPNFFDLGNFTGLDTFKQFDFSAASSQRTGAQIASYISLVCSTGTIILGMILDGQYRDHRYMTAAEARLFLATLEHPRFGLEPLAILYALPYALLMWGMIAFAGACTLVFFDGTMAQTQVPMTLISAIAVASVAWCLYITWNHESSWLDQLKQGIRRVRAKTRNRGS